MKICFISTVQKITNVHSTGGQEVWGASFLTKSISINKHLSFDLLAPQGSINKPPKINLIPIIEKSLDELSNDEFFDEASSKNKDLYNYFVIAYIKAILHLKNNQSKYDLVIESSGNPFISTSWNEFKVPLLIIAHRPVEHRYIRFLQRFGLPNNVFICFLSKYQYDNVPFIPIKQKFLIPHGIDISDFKYSNEGGNNILWFGRIDPSSPKGLLESIKIAIQIKKKINIYGSIENKDYFSKEIQPYLNNEYINFNHGYFDKKTVIGNNKLLLLPLKWEEPFGLVMLEAMACGTPVVAFARGSVPEIIKDGETGFLVNPSNDNIRGNWKVKKTGIDGIKEAIAKIYSMPQADYKKMRLACRAHVEKNFTINRMVDKYEKLYKEIIGKNKK